MDKEKLREKIYSMSNSYLPLDMFFNDIEHISVADFNKKLAFSDLEKIADFIIDLQNKFIDYKSYCQKFFVDIQKYISDNACGATEETFGREINYFIDVLIMRLGDYRT